MLIRQPSEPLSQEASAAENKKQRSAQARTGALSNQPSSAAPSSASVKGDAYATQARENPAFMHAVSSAVLHSEDDQEQVVLPGEFCEPYSQGLAKIMARAETYYSDETRQVWRAVERVAVATHRAPERTLLDGNRSLTADPTYSGGGVQWQRLSPTQVELFAGDTQLDQLKSLIESVRQGDFGSCYFLASLASVAMKDPQQLRDMITYDSASGKYRVSFYALAKQSDGSFALATPRSQVQIEVDPALLLKSDNYAKGAQITDLDHDGVSEVGVNLLEKAFALYLDQMKTENGGTPLFGGLDPSLQGYDALTFGGYPDYALMAITGDTIDYHGIPGSLTDTALWNMLSAANAGSPVVVGSPNSSDGFSIQSDGMVAAHAYSVLGTVTVGSERYVVLRNPWGFQEYMGSGAQNGTDDGIFLMPFTAFKQKFNQISVPAGAENTPPQTVYSNTSVVAAFQRFEAMAKPVLTGNPSADNTPAQADPSPSPSPADPPVPSPDVTDTVGELSRGYTGGFQTYMQGLHNRGCAHKNVMAFVQFVMRESYVESNRELFFFAKKVEFFNKLKKAYRDEVTRVTGIKARLAGLINPATGQIKSPLTDAETAILTTAQTDLAALKQYSDIPSSDGNVAVLPDGSRDAVLRTAQYSNLASVTNLMDKLDATIKGLDAKLASVGEDAQLANVDLQNMVQKQTLLIQMLSNLSKATYEIERGVVSKIGS
jgi:hypothetical protein